MVLPLRDELRLPISAVNVDEVNIDFFRVDAEYLPRFLAEYRPGAGMGNWELEQITKRAKRVFSGRYALELDANRRETRLINVKEPQLAEAGVYFAVMSPLGNYDWRKETTYFAVSDMGLSARRYRDQLEVFVSSLASADPLKDVQLSCSTRRATGCRCKPPIRKAIAASIRCRGLACCWPSRASIWRCCASMGRPSISPPSISAPSPGRPSSSICSAGAISIAPASGSTARSCSRAGWPAAAGHGGGAGGETAGRPAARTKAPAAGQFGAAHYGLRLPDDAPLGRWTINLKTAAGSRFEWPFLVEEFLPERLKLQLGKGPDGEVTSLDAALTLPLQGTISTARRRVPPRRRRR
jgi:hypothetical protein